MDAKQKDEHAKEKKENANRKAKVQVSDLNISETLPLSQKKRNKFSKRFAPSPFQVMSIKGTMVTAIRNEKYASRNISQFKKVVSDMVEQELPDADELDAWEDDSKDINSLQGNPQLKVLPFNHLQPVCNRCYCVRIKHPVPYGFLAVSHWKDPLFKKGRDVMS